MKILLPVDFSEYSKPALERGAALAKRLDAELHVLHVWELPERLPSLGSAAQSRLDSKSFAAAVQRTRRSDSTPSCVAERLVRLSSVAVPSKDVRESALRTVGGDPTLAQGDEGSRPKLQKSRAMLAPPALGDHVDRSQS
jgi:nucleotide-binding universal stress UspA family protein